MERQVCTVKLLDWIDGKRLKLMWLSSNPNPKLIDFVASNLNIKVTKDAKESAWQWLSGSPYAIQYILTINEIKLSNYLVFHLARHR